MRKIGDKGQLELSFGMIFSILLIITFITIAGYVLYKFVDFGKGANVNLFVQELQESIDKLWAAPQGTQDLTWSLDDSVTQICFVDFSKPSNNNRELYQELSRFSDDPKINMFLYPIVGGSGNNAGRAIEHVNISSTTAQKNPYCIPNSGKMTVTIKKSFNEALVTVQ
jgi:hypothetical protein